MLVLTRKIGEVIQIGEGIEIKVIAIKGDQVKIGIEAPKNVEIYRKEIYQQIQEENREAASANFHLPDLIKNLEKK